MNTNIDLLNQKIDAYTRDCGFSGVIRVTAKDSILYERSIGYENREEKIEFSDRSMFKL